MKPRAEPTDLVKRVPDSVLETSPLKKYKPTLHPPTQNKNKKTFETTTKGKYGDPCIMFGPHVFPLAPVGAIDADGQELLLPQQKVEELEVGLALLREPLEMALRHPLHPLLVLQGGEAKHPLVWVNYKIFHQPETCGWGRFPT